MVRKEPDLACKGVGAPHSGWPGRANLHDVSAFLVLEACHQRPKALAVDHVHYVIGV
jgi:hypothetical protein